MVLFCKWVCLFNVSMSISCLFNTPKQKNVMCTEKSCMVYSVPCFEKHNACE